MPDSGSAIKQQGGVPASTRDVEFFDIPTPASGIYDAERSRLLKNECVMIQDVMPTDAVGMIAFGNAPGRYPLQKNRLYM